MSAAAAGASPGRHDDLGLLLQGEVGPGELGVHILLVQLQDLQGSSTPATSTPRAQISTPVKPVLPLGMLVLLP
jgi:hypothetical protein